MKVLVSDKLSDKGVEILRSAGLTVDVKTKLTKEELLKEITEYDGLVIRSATKVTAEVINAAKNLKVIGRAGSGLDNVDLQAATKRGIVVMNTPGGNTVTTAEHAIAMTLALARMIPQATASTKAGKWEKNKYMGVELYNKTLGIIGIGQIGSYVAKLARGLMMNIVAFDPYLSQENAKKMGIELVDIKELYRRADIITIHSPLTNETKYLINKSTIKELKDGVIIVNCARGGIINEDDLYEALKSGKIAGAALDVFEKEPADPANPLLTLENFICTPHLGASTTEAQENVALAVAEQIADYLVRGVIRHAVNIPSVPQEILPKIQPYLTLAEKLGSCQSQIYKGGLEKVTIEYRGEAATFPTAPITIALLKGLLSPILEDTVNYVNAPIIAKERGIEVEEVKNVDAGDFSNQISIKVKTGGREGRASGAVFSNKDARITEINGFSVEVIPEGYMLILSNNDKPGVIGSIGTLLGDNNINIARMQFGREAAGGKAISVIGIDSPVSAELLNRIKGLPNVLSVEQIRL